MAKSPIISGSLESGRLGSRVRSGSPAFHRKQFTGSARSSMAEINAAYTKILQRMKAVTPEILREAMEPIFEKSQDYVPVKTGALKASGRLSISGGAGERPSAFIIYGDASSKYAAIVHERTDLNHAAPTRAKFLQSAMEEEFDSLLTHLAVAYATVLQS